MKRRLNVIFWVLCVCAFAAPLFLPVSGHQVSAHQQANQANSGLPAPVLQGSTPPDPSACSATANSNVTYIQTTALQVTNYQCVLMTSGNWMWNTLGTTVIQLRTVGTVAVTQGMTLISQSQAAGCTDTNYTCVIPNISNSTVAAVALDSGAPGTAIRIVQFGAVLMAMSNQPVVNDTVVVGAGGLGVDSSLQIVQVSNMVGIGGKIFAIPSSCPTGVTYCAWVNFEYGQRGGNVVASSFDAATVPAYIQANQTPQVQADWNASSGLASILNKPMIPTNTNQLTNGAGFLTAPVANASLANPSTTVNGQLCTLGGICTIPIGGSGTVTSVAAPSASWPSWLVPTVTNPTTTPSVGVAASAIPNAALANSSTTPNGATCTLGSTCTVYPPLVCSVTITGNTTVSLLASVQTTSTTACTGVVAGGSYSVVPSAAPTSGFGVLSGAYGSATNTLTFFFYQPSVALATAYSIPVKVFRMQ